MDDVSEGYDSNEGDRLEDMIHVVEENFDGNPAMFETLLSDSEKPLYNSYTKYTRLSSVLKLYNLKVGGGWSDASFTLLLEAVKDMLPEDNVLPVVVCHALGHVTSNVSFAAVAVSFTLTVKALEPFFNAAASQFILGQPIPITLWSIDMLSMTKKK
ncbi:hypothetical protein BVRB_6g143410 [Beta vulgaris subsp. vulgaris]|nr:hypothetical protein BVRB_6g143410 [Beta vulgaris subsp. vulgaris]